MFFQDTFSKFKTLGRILDYIYIFLEKKVKDASVLLTGNLRPWTRVRHVGSRAQTRDRADIPPLAGSRAHPEGKADFKSFARPRAHPANRADIQFLAGFRAYPEYRINIQSSAGFRIQPTDDPSSGGSRAQRAKPQAYYESEDHEKVATGLPAEILREGHIDKLSVEEEAYPRYFSPSDDQQLELPRGGYFEQLEPSSGGFIQQPETPSGGSTNWSQRFRLLRSSPHLRRLPRLSRKKKTWRRKLVT